MGRKIVIIGGVALGPKAAARCKRLDPQAEVTIVDENEYISYGGCGMPYYVSGEVQNLDALRSTNADVVRDPVFFRDMKGVTVLNETLAEKIDRQKKTVHIKNLKTGEEKDLPYDKLVIATGARARVPEICGVTLKGVIALSRLEEAKMIREACEKREVKEAVIIGAGFIGLEAAVALADMWGVKVSIVEMMDQVLPGIVSPLLSKMAVNDCAKNGVDVYLSEKVLRMEGDGDHVARVVTDKRILNAQLVITAAGVIPNNKLAVDAGLDVAPFGGIVADEHMRTSDPDIYTGGDCAAIKNIITGKIGYLPLGSMANRQGRVIGSNLAGVESVFPGFVGAWAIKLFKLSFCGVGLTPAKAVQNGFDAIGVSIEQLDRAHFYPEKKMMTLEIVVNQKNRAVYGMQGCCEDGDAIKARIDAVSGVLEYAKPVIEDISNLEVAYSPPFSAAMDAVNTVANVADNVVSGRFHAISGAEFMDLWHNRGANDIFFIDMRPPKASKKIEAEYPEWHAIPLEEIRNRVGELPKDKPIALICNSGLRAYEGLLFLKNQGFKDVSNSMGGMQAVTKMGLKP